MKKKCLIILPRIPYPPIGGDKLKSFNFIKILNELYDLTILIVTEEKLDKESSLFLKSHSSNFKFFQYPKWRFYLNSIRSIFTGNPLQVEYYYFKKVQNYCDDLIIENDIIISNLIRTAQYQNRNIESDKIKLLDMVDSIAINYFRSKDKVKSVFWKMIYAYESKRLMKFEQNCIKNFSATFFVNKSESNYWSKYGNTFHIPNGVNEKLLSALNSKKNNTIIFFGKMNYQPNIDAVLWYVNNVHHLVNKNIKLLILGAHPTEKIKKLDKINNINVKGYTKNPYEILSNALAIISPMQTGAGIQNKVLEGMALGKLNLLSSLAAEPIIGAQNGKHFLVENDPLKFAELINDIFTNTDSYQHIGENARELISTKYTWKNYNLLFQEMIEKIN
jgi:glycosyltransferase involved in cell wall biosynthesis